MENEVKPTWRLAWGLWWRMTLIGIGVSLAVYLAVLLILSATCGVALLPLLPWRSMPW